MADDKKELWAAWTHDAISAYSEPDDLDADEIIDDMVDTATAYADAMLEEYEARFSSGPARKKRSKRKKKPDLDDDDDDD